MTIDLQPSQHISVAIARPVGVVDDFLGKPENFIRWAKGLGASIRHAGDQVWVAEGPLGKVNIRFTAANGHGIHDHEVELPTGERVLNPLRVIANGAGSEVVFSLFHRPGMTGGDFARDAAWVRRDLDALKALLEGGAAEDAS